MVVLVRFFQPTSFTKSGGIFRRFSYRPPSEFSGEVHPSDLGLLPLRREMGALFSLKFQISSGKGETLMNGASLCSKASIFQVTISEEINGMLTKLCHAMMELISDHQGMTLHSFSSAFVLANTLMFILPFEALAESCEAGNSFMSMPLLFAIALIGAAVGGLLARQRRGELERLNDQLRQINAALRRQAKIESYAPNLRYAPVGRIPEKEVIVDTRKQELISVLKSGKKFLRNQDLDKAYMEFKVALELAQRLGDYVEEKKAARGLGSSLQRQGKYREAIKYYSRILEICKQVGEDSGSTQAYGAIADCYTELGDLERAGKFYDKYIAALNTD